VNFEGGVNNLFGDFVLSHGKHSRAKTAKPQTTVSRKGAKNAKDAKNAGWAGDVLGPDGPSPPRESSLLCLTPAYGQPYASVMVPIVNA
jgi:orotidine-5'-phosphate decarboxylase